MKYKMTLKEQKLYIINWLNELSSKFQGATFVYGYNKKTNRHVISVDIIVYDSDIFDFERDLLFDNFENPNNIDILFLPSDDKLLHLLMPSIECIINLNFSLQDENSYYKIGAGIYGIELHGIAHDIDLHSVSCENKISIENTNNNYALAA